MPSNNQQVFLELVRAGLWADVESTGSRNQGFTEAVDWERVYQLASEQSVVGLVLAGIEHSNVKPAQDLLLQWIGEVQMLEQQNKSMNQFVAELVLKMRKADIYTLLVKGQGIAQSYEKPLWRTSGDIDLLLDDNNYEKVKALLLPLADEVQIEDIGKKHQAIIIKGFDVELHGKMPFGLSRRADKVLDTVINVSLKRGGARVWRCNNSDIYLPNVDNDVIIVFTHFLRHFFIEGVGLRQICDWCRLLYIYRDSLNYELLESRIRKMGLVSEWKAFYNLASRYLGMPDYDSRLMVNGSWLISCDSRFDKKADRIMELVLESGNFGHNKDLSYRTRYSGLTYKIVAAWRRLKDFAAFIPVFPLDAPKFFFTYMFNKVK